MLWLKSCPRCRGDLLRTSHDGEHVLSCLQCGHALAELQAKRLVERPRPEGAAPDAERRKEACARPPRHDAAA